MLNAIMFCQQQTLCRRSPLSKINNRSANRIYMDSSESSDLINLNYLNSHHYRRKQFQSENSSSMFILITEILKFINLNANTLGKVIGLLGYITTVTNTNQLRSFLTDSDCGLSVIFIFLLLLASIYRNRAYTSPLCCPYRILFFHSA